MLRRTPLKRGKPLRKASKKRASALRVYSVKRKTFLGEHQCCAAGPILLAKAYPAGTTCTKVATDVHHKAGRGLNLNAESLFLPVCRRCHDWIHEHPAIARALSLLK